MNLADVKMVTEVPRVENSMPIMEQASELLYAEVGQKLLGDDNDQNCQGKERYFDEINQCRLFVAMNCDASVIGAATLDLILPGVGHELRTIAVDPEYRNRRIGSQLLYIAEKSVLNDGLSHLLVSPHPSALGFYEYHDFRYVKDVRFRNVMVKKLSF